MLASTVTQMILLSWNQACRWPLFMIWFHSRSFVILITFFINILLLLLIMSYLHASCFILLVAPA